MLEVYEAFQTYNVPKKLEHEIFDSNRKNIQKIENFSKINIFIGPNNSGKSKIIRELIRETPVLYYGTTNWTRIKELIEEIFSIAYEKLRTIGNIDIGFKITNSENEEIINTKTFSKAKQRLTEYTEAYDVNSTIEFIENSLIILPSQMIRNTSFFVQLSNGSSHYVDDKQRDNLFLKFDEIIASVLPLIEELKKFRFSSLSAISIPRIYIPSIRTLRPFAMKINIKEDTIKEYQLPQPVSIYNGQDFPDEVFKLNNSRFINRQELIDFQNLLSKEFFGGKPVALTYDNDGKILLIKIGEEVEKPIYELGDGLQMMIILIFPFFKYKSGVIAIEEPELFIHPGLQKTFIKFLTSNLHTRNFQIFLTTHSNHIIDSINQSDLVSLFSVRKKEKENDNSQEKVPDFIVENLAFGNENFLNLLGIHNTSVYLSNCTIWVEGITDKLYIQKFISEYLKSIDVTSKYSVCKEFKEGINYSFALTGGDSIIHWDFSDENEYYENTKNIIVKRFCSKSLVIVDNDFGKNKNRKELLQGLLKERFIELENPEIENFLSQEVINKTLLTYSSICKANKSLSFPTIKHEHFKQKKIGFIIDKILLKEYQSVKTFASTRGEKSSLKSGDKFIFCEKALQFINSENLTDESKRLVELILDFVITRNAFL